MAHDTQVFFKHDDLENWRDHFSEMRRILGEFGAQAKKVESGDHKGDFAAYILTDCTIRNEDSERFSHTVSQCKKQNICCDDLSLLPDISLLNVHAWFSRTRMPLPVPVAPTDTVIPRRDVTIGLTYDFLLYKYFPPSELRSPGVFSMNFCVPLDPMHAYSEVKWGEINYLEILEFYEIVKRIHVEVGFSITSGCLRDYYNVFGLTEGGTDYDNLFRFDKHGVNRLNSAFEEMRDLLPGDDARYLKDDKFLFSVVTEYEHPVPIILRDPYKRMK